jgi:hypothetical protein
MEFPRPFEAEANRCFVRMAGSKGPDFSIDDVDAFSVQSAELALENFGDLS